MNTKQSFTIGWIAYTAAFGIGGGLGIYKYWYAPGGRKEREAAADLRRAEEAAREAEEEQRIREERRRAKESPTAPAGQT
ncbi:unnamed protein product [Chondrus crispus]|uniref:Uncharacterized protein n=1 Tax=Chondrus crispus TaxID=2769 RepID=R7QDJ2_CHOCR|nr:unnamed protein product [Chondrus crispus]CDF35475.1 unnamed protein product [Chondrus crispus]|eukprot:XP_005715294.1 unnamed protein product [Chondrus crispus]